jgi:hypothetical protein
MPTEPGHCMSFAIAWPQALYEGSSDIVTMHERYALKPIQLRPHGTLRPPWASQSISA